MKTVVVQSQQRWEYVVANRRSEIALAEEMNTLGQQGWELVAAQFYKDGKGVPTWTAFLKRPCNGPASKPPETNTSGSSIGVATASSIGIPGSTKGRVGGSSMLGGQSQSRVSKEVKITDFPDGESEESEELE
jgi:hypothetical protein